MRNRGVRPDPKPSDGGVAAGARSSPATADQQYLAPGPGQDDPVQAGTTSGDEISVKRVVVVDDQCSQRDGRVLWLSQVPGVSAKGLNFEQAIALGPQWREVDVAVLDGHDRRAPAKREAAARAAGIDPIAPHDNFIGLRVAAVIRQHCPGKQALIILISAYAREHELLARRIQQAGIDFVFEHYEVDQDQETFVRAVMSPHTFSPHQMTVNWSAHGYAEEPNVNQAIAAVEASPAGAMLLTNDMHKRHKDLEWRIRRLREDLQRYLPRVGGEGESPGGPRGSRAPNKIWLADQFRKIFGKDLPVDPE